MTQIKVEYNALELLNLKTLSRPKEGESLAGIVLKKEDLGEGAYSFDQLELVYLQESPMSYRSEPISKSAITKLNKVNSPKSNLTLEGILPLDKGTTTDQFEFSTEGLTVPDLVFFPINDLKVVAAYSENVKITVAIIQYGPLDSIDDPTGTNAYITLKIEGDRRNTKKENVQLKTGKRGTTSKDNQVNQIGISRFVVGQPCPPFWDPYEWIVASDHS